MQAVPQDEIAGGPIMQAVPQDEIAGGNDNHISDSELNDAEAWLRSVEFNA